MHLPLPPLEPEYIAAKEFTVVERLGSPAAIPHLLPRTVDWERLYRFLLNFSRRPWPRKPKGPIFSKGCWRLIQDPDPIIPGNAMSLGQFASNLEELALQPTSLGSLEFRASFARPDEPHEDHFLGQRPP
jgi:hypothetical protein